MDMAVPDRRILPWWAHAAARAVADPGRRAGLRDHRGGRLPRAARHGLAQRGAAPRRGNPVADRAHARAAARHRDRPARLHAQRQPRQPGALRTRQGAPAHRLRRTDAPPGIGGGGQRGLCRGAPAPGLAREAPGRDRRRPRGATPHRTRRARQHHRHRRHRPRRQGRDGRHPPRAGSPERGSPGARGPARCQRFTAAGSHHRADRGPDRRRHLPDGGGRVAAGGRTAAARQPQRPRCAVSATCSKA